MSVRPVIIGYAEDDAEALRLARLAQQEGKTGIIIVGKNPGLDESKTVMPFKAPPILPSMTTVRPERSSPADYYYNKHKRGRKRR